MGCCSNVQKTNQDIVTSDYDLSDNIMQRSQNINKQKFICLNSGRLSQIYQIKESLGCGAFGQVRLCVHKVSQIQRAVKSILKIYVRHTDDTVLLKEVDLLSKLDHPNIIQVKQVFQDRRYYHIVTELCTGGELFSRITKEGSIDENQARKYMRQILSAVYFCHSNDIVHRDLKPENVLFYDQSYNSPLKIIDFGVSSVIQQNQFVGQYGTPFYTAPEVIQGKYDEKCDI